MNDGQIIIKNIVLSAPERPGIYQMLDASGEILYIGKAKNLKNRLKNYINIDQLSQRIIHMITKVRKVEYITTFNESEAFLLESRLIKKHQPKYNILLKDDKSFPYIKLRTDHVAPQIIKYRGKIDHNGKYFGPFPNNIAVEKVLNFLQKTFKIRNCSDNNFASRKRPCLQYQIGKCSAPCVMKISHEEYNNSIKEAIEFLEGKSTKLQNDLAAEMNKASMNMEYEKAALIRDKIKNLSYIQTEADNHIKLLHNIDVIAVIREANISCISVSFYRYGHFYGSKLIFNDTEEALPELLSRFISNFYLNLPAPEEIIVNQDLEDIAFLSDGLTQLSNSKVTIIVNPKGDKKKLLEKESVNALEGLRKKIKDTGIQRAIYKEIADIFSLPSVPERIEVYDNSHIMGTAAIGAYIVATPSGFVRKDYRYYNVQNKMGDDYAMLREVLTKRLQKVVSSPTSKPDLLIIDGGKGQLSTALTVMKHLGLTIPVIAMAKGKDRNSGNEDFYLPSGEVVNLDNRMPVMKYLQIIRDEAHKFAITSHRKKRKSYMTVSILDSINDIGASRKKALLDYFGSIEAIKSASPEEIAKIKGINIVLAKRILDAISF